MTPKLKNLLVAVAVIAGTITTVVFVPRAGVTRADLIDAGIADGARRERDCLVYDEPGGVNICPNGRRYCRKTVPLRVFSEGDGTRSVVTHRAAARKVLDESAWCGPVRATALGDDETVDVDFPCACSTGSNCAWTRPLFDGGTESVAAPTGLTMRPGTWNGAGCVRKACVEVLGASSWPAECPGG